MIGIIFDINTIRDLPLYKSVNNTIRGNILFVAVDDDILEQLEETRDKKMFISSRDFLDGIQYSYCTIYDEKNNLIYIDGCDPKYIPLLLDTIARFFEEGVTIVASYKDGLIGKGFGSPEVCSEKGDICLKKKNSFFKDTTEKSVKAEYNFVLSQRHKNHCEIVVKFTRDTREFLRHIVNAGVTVSGDNYRTQKEFFGNFNLVESNLSGKKVVHTLEVDKSSLVSGNEDNIKANASLYNFHSHPFSAYQKYRVNYGPPSDQDYKSIFLMMTKYNSIAHFVPSVEGLYVVSLNPEKYNINPESVIQNIDYDDVETLGELKAYLKRVNSYDVFRLKLLGWDSKEFESGIRVEFGKSGKYGNCKIRE